MASYIVILSNGFAEATFYGPFPDHDSALEWAEQEAGGMAWEIAPLTAPDA